MRHLISIMALVVGLAFSPTAARGAFFIGHVYDAQERLTRTVYTLDGSPAGAADYGYDAAGNLTSVLSNWNQEVMRRRIGVTIPSEGGVTTGAGDYGYNTVATLRAVANPGKRFLYWTDQQGTILSRNPVYFVTMDSDATIMAWFGRPGFPALYLLLLNK